MQEANRMYRETPSMEGIPSSGVRSLLCRSFSPVLIFRVAAILLIGLLAGAAWRYFPRSITLYTPLAGEAFVVGMPVLLDDDVVGKVSGICARNGGEIAELRLCWLSSGQKRKLKEGLVRVAGYRMIWLTSGFVDQSGPPLIDGDQVPVVNRIDWEKRKAFTKFFSWLLPGTGVGLLWLLWRGIRRWLT